jgi:hypothetical protein
MRDLMIPLSSSFLLLGNAVSQIYKLQNKKHNNHIHHNNMGCTQSLDNLQEVSNYIPPSEEAYNNAAAKNVAQAGPSPAAAVYPGGGPPMHQHNNHQRQHPHNPHMCHKAICHDMRCQQHKRSHERRYDRRERRKEQRDKRRERQKERRE